MFSSRGRKIRPKFPSCIFSNLTAPLWVIPRMSLGGLQKHSTTYCLTPYPPICLSLTHPTHTPVHHLSNKHSITHGYLSLISTPSNALMTYTHTLSLSLSLSHVSISHKHAFNKSLWYTARYHVQPVSSYLGIFGSLWYKQSYQWKFSSS